ncbi:hypothetical protein B0H65DRAFT_566368, partial [Neurospora tetraspora]
TYHPWDPETGYYPEKGFTVKQIYERSWRNREKPVDVPDFKNEISCFCHESHNSADFPDISVYWIEDWGNNPAYGEDSFNRVKGTEAICRAEAAHLGFDAVVIRAGLHNKRNQHDAFGTIRTKNDPRSGRIVNDTTDADWHLTVFMGYDVDNLVIHGRVYLVWDHKAMFGMRIVKDASERKHLAPNEKPSAITYHWTLCYFTGICPQVSCLLNPRDR